MRTKRNTIVVSSLLSSADSYSFFGFAITTILLSLVTQLTIQLFFSSLLSFQTLPHFITLILTFLVLTLSRISFFFFFSLLVKRNFNISCICVFFFFFFGDVDMFKLFLFQILQDLIFLVTTLKIVPTVVTSCIKRREREREK